MENANVQDTPQNANTQDTSQTFETPQVEAGLGSSGELSVDDIILGNVDDTAPAFGTPANESVETPSSNGLNLIGSSPPSPVLDLPPNLFIAMARDS